MSKASRKIAYLSVARYRRRKSEGKLKESEERFHAIFANAGIAIFLADPDMTIIECNPAMENYLGYSRTELVGRNIAEFTHPDDRELNLSIIDKAATKYISNFRMEKRDIRKDGMIAWGSLSVSFLRNESGEVEHIIGMLEDVSTKKAAEEALLRSEEMYRCLVETSPSAISLTDLDGTLLMFNQQALRIYGGGDPSQFIGSNVLNWVSQDQQQYALELLGTLVQGEEIREKLFRLRKNDGSSFIGEVSASRISLADSGQYRLLIITSDVTAREEAVAEVHRLNDELEMIVAKRTAELDFSNRELEGFCYAISHELRAPIARLQGFCEAIKEECEEETDGLKMFYAERIDIASRQLRHVVDAILLLSRLSRTDITREEVNLSTMAEQISHALILSEQSRNLQFIIEPGITTFCDRQLLEICMENLLGNAIKYSSRKETAVIEFGRSVTDDTEAYFVRDNGAGFDMAFADKLFKPFLRLHKESEFPGTGIGLVTVARIIERHGGRIWAEGKEREGATFWFTLDPI